MKANSGPTFVVTLFFLRLSVGSECIQASQLDDQRLNIINNFNNPGNPYVFSSRFTS